MSYFSFAWWATVQWATIRWATARWVTVRWATVRTPLQSGSKFFGASKFLRGTTIYSDFNHKHVEIDRNKAWYPYTMSLELYGDRKVQIYAWDWHFKKFLTKKIGCPEGCFMGLGVQKATQTPCWLRPLMQFQLEWQVTTSHFQLTCYLDWTVSSIQCSVSSFHSPTFTQPEETDFHMMPMVLYSAAGTVNSNPLKFEETTQILDLYRKFSICMAGNLKDKDHN